jgi:hypothetical protein
MRRGHQQHLGAMGGERAPAHGTRDDAGQVEDADTAERTIACGKLLRRRLADFFNREHGEARQRLAAT